MPSTPLTELTNNVIVPTRGTGVADPGAAGKASTRRPLALLMQERMEKVQELLSENEKKRSILLSGAAPGSVDVIQQYFERPIRRLEAELNALQAKLNELSKPKKTHKQERKAQERAEGGGKKAKKRRLKDAATMLGNGANAREESALVVKKMSGNVKYTDKQKRAILLELETSTISVPKLAEKYNCSRSSIDSWRNKFSVKGDGGKKKKPRRSADGIAAQSEAGAKSFAKVHKRNREETGGCFGVKCYNACRKKKRLIANDEQGRTYGEMVKFSRGGGIKVVDADLLLTLSGQKDNRFLRLALKRVGLVLLDPKTGRECAKLGRAASWWTQPGANPVFFNENWVPHLEDISQFSSRQDRTTRYDAEGKLLGAW